MIRHINRLGRIAAIAVAMAALVALQAEAAIYYVAPNGSDANPGSLSSPFQTLHKAATVAMPGDTCLIRAGTYQETLTPPRSGSSSAPITFSAYSNEVVTIDAANPVTGWTYVSNSIYEAPVTWSLGMGFDEVFVDGVMIHQASIPAWGSGDVLHPTLASVSVPLVNTNNITSRTWGGQPTNYWAGAYFVGGVGLSWAWQSAQILSSDGNTIIVNPATETSGVWWFTNSGNGYLFGSLNMLTSDNQWFLQTNAPGNYTLYLRITGGASPATHNVELKQRNWCVDVDNANYITVGGLNLWGGAVRLTGVGNVLQNCNAQYLSHYTIVSPNYAENDGVEQGDGVELNGTSNTVTGCTICNTAGCGVYSTGTNNVINRNFICNTDYSGAYARAIVLHGDQEKVLFNTIRYSGRDLICPEGTGSDIFFNDLSFPGLLCKDLGLIYVWGTDAMDSNGVCTRIAYNWVHDNNFPIPAPLLYFDNYDANFYVDHNVCWNSGGDSGIRVNLPAVGHIICNNTVFNCANVGADGYDAWNLGSPPDPGFWTNDFTQYVNTNNLYLSNSPQTQLVNWTNNNFTLLSNSPAINAGVVMSGFTDGYMGSKPDLGAYEYGGPAWQAGTNARPSLVAVSHAPGEIKIYASPDAAYYTLYSATNPGPSAVWTPVTNAPFSTDDLWYVVLNPTSTQTYYRLQGR
jgi:hypothetical protein